MDAKAMKVSEYARTSNLTRCLAIAGCMLASPMSHAAASQEQVLSIPMQKHQGYSSERCVVFAGSTRLRFSFSSDYAVNFNLHHHTETTTEYPVGKSTERDFSTSVTLPDGGEYCFMWENPQSQSTEFSISLRFSVEGS